MLQLWFVLCLGPLVLTTGKQQEEYDGFPTSLPIDLQCKERHSNIKQVLGGLLLKVGIIDEYGLKNEQVSNRTYLEFSFKNQVQVYGWVVRGRLGGMLGPLINRRGFVASYVVTFVNKNGETEVLNDPYTDEEEFVSEGNLARPEELSIVELEEEVETRTLRMSPVVWSGVPYMAVRLFYCAKDEDLSPDQQKEEEEELQDLDETQTVAEAKQTSLEGKENKMRQEADKEKESKVNRPPELKEAETQAKNKTKSEVKQTPEGKGTETPAKSKKKTKVKHPPKRKGTETPAKKKKKTKVKQPRRKGTETPAKNKKKTKVKQPPKRKGTETPVKKKKKTKVKQPRRKGTETPAKNKKKTKVKQPPKRKGTETPAKNKKKTKVKQPPKRKGTETPVKKKKKTKVKQPSKGRKKKKKRAHKKKSKAGKGQKEIKKEVKENGTPKQVHAEEKKEIKAETSDDENTNQTSTDQEIMKQANKSETGGTFALNLEAAKSNLGVKTPMEFEQTNASKIPQSPHLPYTHCVNPAAWRYAAKPTPVDQFSARGNPQQAWRAILGLNYVPYLFPSSGDLHEHSSPLLEVVFRKKSRVDALKVGGLGETGQEDQGRWGVVTKFLVLYKDPLTDKWIYNSDSSGMARVFKVQDPRGRDNAQEEAVFNLPAPLNTHAMGIFPLEWANRPYVALDFLACYTEPVVKEFTEPYWTQTKALPPSGEETVSVKEQLPETTEAGTTTAAEAENTTTAQQNIPEKKKEIHEKKQKDQTAKKGKKEAGQKTGERKKKHKKAKGKKIGAELKSAATAARQLLKEAEEKREQIAATSPATKTKKAKGIKTKGKVDKDKKKGMGKGIKEKGKRGKKKGVGKKNKGKGKLIKAGKGKESQDKLKKGEKKGIKGGKEGKEEGKNGTKGGKAGIKGGKKGKKGGKKGKKGGKKGTKGGKKGKKGGKIGKTGEKKGKKGGKKAKKGGKKAKKGGKKAKKGGKKAKKAREEEKAKATPIEEDDSLKGKEVIEIQTSKQEKPAEAVWTQNATVKKTEETEEGHKKIFQTKARTSKVTKNLNNGKTGKGNKPTMGGKKQRKTQKGKGKKKKPRRVTGKGKPSTKGRKEKGKKKKGGKPKGKGKKKKKKKKKGKTAAKAQNETTAGAQLEKDLEEKGLEYKPTKSAEVLDEAAAIEGALSNFEKVENAVMRGAEIKVGETPEAPGKGEKDEAKKEKKKEKKGKGKTQKRNRGQKTGGKKKGKKSPGKTGGKAKTGKGQGKTGKSKKKRGKGKGKRGKGKKKGGGKKKKKKKEKGFCDTEESVLSEDGKPKRLLFDEVSHSEIMNSKEHYATLYLLQPPKTVTGLNMSTPAHKIREKQTVISFVVRVKVKPESRWKLLKDKDKEDIKIFKPRISSDFHILRLPRPTRATTLQIIPRAWTGTNPQILLDVLGC